MFIARWAKGGRRIDFRATSPWLARNVLQSSIFHGTARKFRVTQINFMVKFRGEKKKERKEMRKTWSRRQNEISEKTSKAFGASRRARASWFRMSFLFLPLVFRVRVFFLLVVSSIFVMLFFGVNKTKTNRDSHTSPKPSFSLIKRRRRRRRFLSISKTHYVKKFLVLNVFFTSFSASASSRANKMK